MPFAAGSPASHSFNSTMRTIDMDRLCGRPGPVSHSRGYFSRKCRCETSASAQPVAPPRSKEPCPAVNYKLAITELSRFEPPFGKILDSVSFQVQPGQLFGLIGASGSGKSTVLRALNRLWEPARGAVKLEGQDVRDIPVQELRIRVGMVFQSPNLFEGTVEHNVRFGPSLREVNLSDEQVQELLLRAGLQPSKQFLSRTITELSGGEAQRVSIARALANSPEVLLMDEPTSSLDPSATRKVEETICRLQHAEGMTVVLVSHSMPQIERLADMAGLLADGRIVAVGPPMDLRESENPPVASFFTGEHDG